MATVGTLVVRIGADVGGLSAGLRSAQQQLQGFGQSLRGLGSRLTLGVSGPLLGIATAALNSAMQFERSMDVMQAVTGATAAEMASLQAQALQLGRDTSFSAGEAAQAQLELAKAGMTVNQVLAATPGVLNLAAAGNLAVGQAAEVAANAVNAFGLTAAETGRVADLLASTANSSSVEVQDLAASFNMVAAVASSFGFRIEEVSAALAVLGNNGLKGSDAGTSLKTMFMRLAAPTAKAKGLMQEYGIAVYDAQGKMLPLLDIVANLEGGLGGLSEAQRNSALQTIFGADAMRAINILMKEGSGTLEEMTGKITEQGAAQAAADARMRGLAGALEYFKGTLESVLIEGASPFLDSLNGMVRGAADLLAGISNLSPETQRWIAILGVAAAAAGPLLLVLGALVSAFAVLIGPVGAVIAVVGALAAAWATNFGGIQEKTAAAWGVIQPVLAEIWAWLQGVIPPALAYLQAQFVAGWSAISAAVSAAWSVVGPMLATLAAWLRGQLPGAMAVLQALFTAAWGVIGGVVTQAAANIGPALATIGGALGALWGMLQQLWTTVSGFLGPALERLGQSFGSLAPQLSALTPVFDGLLTTIIESVAQVGVAFADLWTTLQPILQAIGAALVVIIDFGINMLTAAIEQMSAIVTPILLELQLVIQTVATILSETIAAITAVLTGDWAAAWESASTIMATFGAFVLRTMQNLYSLVAAIVGAIATAVVQTLTDMGVDVESLLSAFKAFWDNMWDSLTDAVDAVIDVVQGLWDTLMGLWEWLRTHVFVNPFSGWSSPNLGGATPGGDIGLHAKGTRHFEGGWTWVGEEGPELVQLPRGTRILSNEDSLGLVGAAAAGTGGQMVTIGPVYIQQEMDWESLRWRLRELVRRRSA